MNKCSNKGARWVEKAGFTTAEANDDRTIDVGCSQPMSSSSSLKKTALVVSPFTVLKLVEQPHHR